MHIAQLEAALELSRSSIRFYEKEGLLTPERLDNGYRDYSEEDLETLRRIKLLRALGLPLEDIKALQAGVLDLPVALRAQEDRLRRERRQREAALSLCRTLEGEGVAYRELEARPYLEELSRLERAGVWLQPPPPTASPSPPAPGGGSSPGPWTGPCSPSWFWVCRPWFCAGGRGRGSSGSCSRTI